MNDHAKALRAAFLDAQLKHRRITRMARWAGAAYRRLHAMRKRDPSVVPPLGLELDSAGLAYVTVRSACASGARCVTNKKGRPGIALRQA